MDHYGRIQAFLTVGKENLWLDSGIPSAQGPRISGMEERRNGVVIYEARVEPAMDSHQPFRAHCVTGSLVESCARETRLPNPSRIQTPIAEAWQTRSSYRASRPYEYLPVGVGNIFCAPSRAFPAKKAAVAAALIWESPSRGRFLDEELPVRVSQ